VTVHLTTEQLVAMASGAAAQGLLLSTEHVLTESNRRVPHEEGTLERSGAADVDPATLTGSVSYDTPYAVRQHEDLSLRHDDGRRAKYLETASTDEAQTVAALMAQAARKGLD
jgi:hypothetical protein